MAQIHNENEKELIQYTLVMPTDEPSSPAVDYYDSWKDDYKFEVDIEATMQYKAYVKNELENNFPLKYVITHCIIMFILNISLIVIQVVAMQNNAAFSELGLAIWVGFYNLFTSFLVLLTSELKFKLI
jgi:hypothetical protein